MPTHEEIYNRVSAAVGEALNVDVEEIKPISTLQGDLGAESIDFLDIVFRLEREFDIQIPQQELFPEAIFRDAPESVKDGRLTPEGVEVLRARMPLADFAHFENNPVITDISDLFTVQLITNYIQNKLEGSRQNKECKRHFAATA
jgi:acyl carrier protein